MADEKNCATCGGAGVVDMPVTFNDSQGVSHDTTVHMICYGCTGTGKAKDAPRIQGEPLKR